MHGSAARATRQTGDSASPLPLFAAQGGLGNFAAGFACVPARRSARANRSPGELRPSDMKYNNSSFTASLTPHRDPPADRRVDRARDRIEGTSTRLHSARALTFCNIWCNCGARIAASVPVLAYPFRPHFAGYPVWACVARRGPLLRRRTTKITAEKIDHF